MGWWNERLRARTVDWTFAPVGGPDRTGEPVEAERAYLDVFLRSMRLVDVRKGLTRFHGVVSSTCTLAHRGQGEASFFVLVTPAELRDVEPGQAARVLVMNRRLVGPTPYRGGDVGLELGLFSVAAADLAAPYIETLETMAGVAGVAFLGPALAFVQPLRRGLDLLLGAGDASSLEIGLAVTLPEVRTGTYALMGAPKHDIDPAALSLDGDGKLLRAGKDVTEWPYLVISIEARAQRDDWSRIPEVAASYEALSGEVRTGDFERVEEAFAVFRRTAVMSPDLLAADGARLATRVREEVSLALGATPTARHEQSLPALADVALYG